MIEVDVQQRLGAFELDAAFRNDAGITALFGRSGSGKSTMISLIAGLKRPDRGHIRLDGQVLTDTASRVFVPKHRRRIGLVFQDALLFPHLTVRQNLLFGRWFRPRVARGVSLDMVVATLGIAPLLQRWPAQLSGGERQRVALGRALLANPRLLLLDEPLASLDMPRRLEILPLIERLRDEFGIPMVYVSHAVEEVARLASTVVLLDGGRVTAVGAPADVLGAPVEADRFARVSVLELSAGAFDARYGLTALHHPAGIVPLPGRIAAPGQRVRVVVHATDVTLATRPPQHLSIRTVLRGTIAAIARDGDPTATVTIALHGGGQLTALATRKALDELGLQPAAPIYALIKSVALDERTLATMSSAPPLSVPGPGAP
jgi:molybdate transport system ATP-binding protein